MKTRISSAIVALLITVPLAIIGGTPFAILIMILALLGYHEILKIREEKMGKIPLIPKVCSYILLFLMVFNNIGNNEFTFVLDYQLIYSIFILILVPLVIYADNKKYNINDAIYIIGILFFIGTAFNVLITIRDYSIVYLLFLFVITISTDTFALLTGMLIGKHKLSPTISPKKTWEGVFGGTIFGVLIGFVFYYNFINSVMNIWVVLGIILILSLVGQLGDLVFSSIKRHYGKKDFSNIMPGHGGVLDRLDSIIFVIMTFVLFIKFL